MRRAMSTVHESPDIFQSTRWSMVRRAGAEGHAGQAALEDLCCTYRKPVERFIAARTGDPQEAEDLVQSYFADLLRRGYLARADRNAGKFRAFLSADVKLFLNNVRRKATAEKCGARLHVPLENDDSTEPAAAAPEDALFDRHWALEVFHSARLRLREEYTAQSKAEVFAALEPLMDKTGEAGMFDAVARRLGMSEGSLKVALHRLRERLGRHLLEIVSDTVNSPDEAREELRYLFRALNFATERTV
jgi:DNA-directed RNA polymerase specialized sigma24 family protein